MTWGRGLEIPQKWWRHLWTAPKRWKARAAPLATVEKQNIFLNFLNERKKGGKVVRLKGLIRGVHLTKEISWLALSRDYLWYCVPLTQYLCKVPFEKRRHFLFCCCVGIILARGRANFNFRYSFVFQGSVPLIKGFDYTTTFVFVFVLVFVKLVPIHL